MLKLKKVELEASIRAAQVAERGKILAQMLKDGSIDECKAIVDQFFPLVEQ
jgi:hypothetical protein